MKLSFSTLGCPAWTYQDILRRAAEYGFHGIAIRGLNGELDLVKVAEFQPTRRAETRRQAERAGIAINLLGASTKLMVPDAELAGSQQNAKEHIDLAADLYCPFVRVFGGAIPVGLSHVAAIRRAAERLRELGDHAATRGVKVLMESHDDWVVPAFLRRALEAANHPNVGALWDIHHPFRIAGIGINEAWEALAPFVTAIDVKDSREDFAARLGYRYVRIGEGEIPLRDALALALRNGYDGWLTLEWEKRWHPDIEEPEVVFPHFVKSIGELLASLK